MKELFDVLVVLQGTPVPNLFIVSALIFFLLALVGKIGSTIELSHKRQMIAGAIGALFLFFGVSLYILPSIPQTATTVTPNSSFIPSPTVVELMETPTVSIDSSENSPLLPTFALTETPPPPNITPVPTLPGGAGGSIDPSGNSPLLPTLALAETPIPTGTIAPPENLPPTGIKPGGSGGSYVLYLITLGSIFIIFGSLYFLLRKR